MLAQNTSLRWPPRTDGTHDFVHVMSFAAALAFQRNGAFQLSACVTSRLLENGGPQ
jgi:hypothetical protein